MLITFEQWVLELWFFTWVNVNLSLLMHTFQKGNNNLSASYGIVLWQFTIYFEVLRHISPRSLLLNNVQSIQDHFTNVDIIDILQYLQECDLYNKIERCLHLTFCYIYILFYVRWMGNCARVKDNNRLGTQKSVSFDFDEE